MNKFVHIFVLVTLTTLAGCLTTAGGVKVAFNPSKITTPFGTLEFSFSQEEQQKVSSTDQLEKAVTLKNQLNFMTYEFTTGPLPDGCKPFGYPGEYGKFAFPNDGKAVEKIDEKVKKLRESYSSAPDEAEIALSIYKAMAWQSWCGNKEMAILEPGSKINGWLLNDEAVKLYGSANQPEIDVTPKITIVAVEKKEFEGHILPTSINLLLSKYRYEVPPDSESIVSDPNSGSIILAYRQKLQHVKIGGVTRNVLAGGVIRIFVGKTYIYIIDFYSNTDAIQSAQWDAYKKYVESFKYLSEATNK